MPSIEDSTQPYQLLKVRNLESSKRDHFRPDPVPFDRPLTIISKDGEQHTLEVEEGAPLMGVWNALKNLGARNRQRK